MDSEKIVITGIGVISALGNSVEESFDSLVQNRINAGKIDLFDCDIDKPVFKAEISDDSVDNGISCGKRPSLCSKRPSKMRTFMLADIAFNEALTMAGIGGGTDGFTVGVCCGTTVASQLNDIEFYKKFRAGMVKSYDPVNNYLAGNLSEALKLEYKFSGPALNVVNACSSGADAIGVAMTWIQNNLCDIAIAGGADELNRVPVAGFNSLGILSGSLCRPFDRNRDGLNLGEGAGFVVLEKESVAVARDAGILAECCSYANSADAYHLTAPRPDGKGLRTAIEKALKNAGINADDIDFINAHGTATKNNDLVEGLVFRDMFPRETKIFSIKGYTGHTLGAAGAIDAVLTVLSIGKQWIPGNAGFSIQDPEIGFSPVRDAIDLSAGYALSTSLAFGGNNAALIFSKV